MKRYLQQLYEFYLNTFLSFSLIGKGISPCKTKFSKLLTFNYPIKKHPRKNKSLGKIVWFAVVVVLFCDMDYKVEIITRPIEVFSCDSTRE